MSKQPCGFVLIVRAAAQFDVRDSGRAAISVWDDVVELQECRLATTSAGGGEGAAPFVAPPDLTLHGGGNVSGMPHDVSI
jgi:hypothetical protein